MDKNTRGRKDIPTIFAMDMSGDESAPGGGGHRCPIFWARGKAFDREEILERLFKALRELEFWADMHERVSKMMREREEKRQRQTEDRRLDSRDMYRNHFKSIGKNGKRKL